jgi:hypothetical protein
MFELVWIKCKKVTLMWGKEKLKKNDPWPNIGTFLFIV